MARMWSSPKGHLLLPISIRTLRSTGQNSKHCLLHLLTAPQPGLPHLRPLQPNPLNEPCSSLRSLHAVTLHLGLSLSSGITAKAIQTIASAVSSPTILESRNDPAFQGRRRFPDPVWASLSVRRSRLHLRAVGQPREFRYVRIRHGHHGCLGFCFHWWRAHLCSLPGIRALKATGCPRGIQSPFSLVVARRLGFAPGGQPEQE